MLDVRSAALISSKPCFPFSPVVSEGRGDVQAAVGRSWVVPLVFLCVFRCTRKLYDLARGIYRVSVREKVKELREVRELLIALERGDVRGGGAPVSTDISGYASCVGGRGKPSQAPDAAKSSLKGEQNDTHSDSDAPCPASRTPSSLSPSGSEAPAVSSSGTACSYPPPPKSCSVPISAEALSEAWLTDLSSSSRWMFRDSAVGFRILCHKIRIYESAILRALRFNVGPLHLPFSALRLQLKAFLTRCHCRCPCPASPSGSLKGTPDGRNGRTVTDSSCFSSPKSYRTTNSSTASSSPSSSSSSIISSSPSVKRAAPLSSAAEDNGRPVGHSREASPSGDAQPQDPGGTGERGRREGAVAGESVKVRAADRAQKVVELSVKTGNGGSSLSSSISRPATQKKRGSKNSECGTDSSGTTESPPSVRVTRSKSRGAVSEGSATGGSMATAAAAERGRTKKGGEDEADEDKKRARVEEQTRETGTSSAAEGREIKVDPHPASSPSTPPRTPTCLGAKRVSRVDYSVGSASSRGKEEKKNREMHLHHRRGAIETDDGEEGKAEVLSRASLPCCCEAWPVSGIAFAQLHEQLHSAALRELLLLFRTPFILERNTNAVVAACVIRAAIACGLPLAYPSSFFIERNETEAAQQPGEGTAAKPGASRPSRCRPCFETPWTRADGQTPGDVPDHAPAAGEESVMRATPRGLSPHGGEDGGHGATDNDAERKGVARRNGVFAKVQEGRERFLQVLEAFDAHVERFLEGLNDPFRRRGTPQETGRGYRDPRKVTRASEGQENDSDEDAIRGPRLYGVDVTEVHAVLGELRLASTWMNDLLHSRGPLLLKNPALFPPRSRPSPQARRDVKRRGVCAFSTPDKDRQVESERKKRKTGDPGASEKLEIERRSTPTKREELEKETIRGEELSSREKEAKEARAE